MTDSIAITPVAHPVSGVARPPGSKSLTNRALIVAALAKGRSHLRGVLDSEDTRVMIKSLRRLGLSVQEDRDQAEVFVEGSAGKPTASRANLWLENSGTSIRFLTALCTLGGGEYQLDGNSRMRERPIGDLARALNSLGAKVECEHANDRPPVVVRASGLAGGATKVAGNISSQFLSALLMVAPCAQTNVELQIDGELVSKPYVEMTRRVMAAFSARVESDGEHVYRIAPQTYQAADYDIEPDASAASYFFALAAITGGRVTVPGLSRESLQGDVDFVNVLEKMGCRVEFGNNSITVQGARLHGIDIDMNAISDTAQTLAAVAPFADGPTRIRNIAHVRHKETDRISAVVTELSRLGLTVEEHSDGLTIFPGPMRPATIQTYDDHRMAMSFALLGLRQPGIVIADPGCTRKTYPRYFDDLQAICGSSR